MTFSTPDILMAAGLFAGIIVVFIRIEHRFTNLEVLLSRLPCVFPNQYDCNSVKPTQTTDIDKP